MLASPGIRYYGITETLIRVDFYPEWGKPKNAEDRSRFARMSFEPASISSPAEACTRDRVVRYFAHGW